MNKKGEITTISLILLFGFGLLVGKQIEKCRLDPESCKKKEVCIIEEIDENTIKKTCEIK